MCSFQKVFFTLWAGMRLFQHTTHYNFFQSQCGGITLHQLARKGVQSNFAASTMLWCCFGKMKRMNKLLAYEELWRNPWKICMTHGERLLPKQPQTHVSHKTVENEMYTINRGRRVAINTFDWYVLFAKLFNFCFIFLNKKLYKNTSRDEDLIWFLKVWLSLNQPSCRKTRANSWVLPFIYTFQLRKLLCALTLMSANDRVCVGRGRLGSIH